MKLRTLATSTAILAATCALAQEPAQIPTKVQERHLHAHIGAVPDPTTAYLGDADVRVQNRPGIGVLVAIDQIPVVEDPALRVGDGIIDRVVVLLGADDQHEFTGRAFVSLRKEPVSGAIESVVVTPLKKLGKSFTAYVGPRPVLAQDATDVAVRGLAVYTGRMVTVPLADLDKVEIAQQ